MNGCNYVVRLYHPRRETLDRTWTLPAIAPARRRGRILVSQGLEPVGDFAVIGVSVASAVSGVSHANLRRGCLEGRPRRRLPVPPEGQALGGFMAADD